ncbi:carboxypeptidase regulatory-like domain-containing protein, partial [Hallella sp.]|uniref:carboxypeptidase-like regulatory domain-containing protein n=1 Tax=Hallella sp. TaxID=2980186 RepID=UPI002850CADF
MRQPLTLIFFLIFALSVTAQVKVTGHVTDLNGKPVTDVIVKLTSGRLTIAYTTTEAKGGYAISVTEKTPKEMMLSFNHIGYERESLAVTADGKEQRHDISLAPKDIALREVTVKPNPLWQRGDTLNHNLAQFLGKGDVTLEDGLKRLPGVEVGSSGGISYMGRPISQFNIEGMDLLGGKYNLATRNIPADYVTNVQIVRNHHSRKVEKDEPSNEVSMNIKLARKAKFKPFGQEETGAGYMEDGDDRFQGLLGLTGMMFTNKFQTICSVKGGNYKGFARADMYDHFGGSDVSTRATSLFGGFDGGAPPQGEYLYQRNGMATLNGILRTDSFTTMKVNADYSYHRATHDISQSTTYLADGGNYVTVGEQTSPLTKIHLPKLSVNYLKNADRVYLSETFVLKGKFEENEGDVVANGSLVEQRRKTSSFEVGNDLFWMGRTEKGARRHVHASVSFRRTPTLRLSFSQDGTDYGQTAQSSTLSMNIGSSFQIPIGKSFRLNLPVSVSAMYDDLETYRTATGEMNDIRGWAFSPTLNPGFEIHSRNRRFYLSAGIGAALKGLYYKKLNYTKPVLNPSMGINYTFSVNSKLSFSTGYTTSIGDMMTLLTEPMQVDYRSVRTSSGIIGESNTWHTSGEWKWQLPMQYFTLSLAASHSEGRQNTLTSQSVSGIDVSSTALLRDIRS